jgi:hypothetical protein
MEFHGGYIFGGNEVNVGNILCSYMQIYKSKFGRARGLTTFRWLPYMKAVHMKPIDTLVLF